MLLWKILIVKLRQLMNIRTSCLLVTLTPIHLCSMSIGTTWLFFFFFLTLQPNFHFCRKKYWNEYRSISTDVLYKTKSEHRTWGAEILNQSDQFLIDPGKLWKKFRVWLLKRGLSLAYINILWEIYCKTDNIWHTFHSFHSVISELQNFQNWNS